MNYSQFQTALDNRFAKLSKKELVDKVIGVCETLYFDYLSFHEVNNFGNADTLMNAIRFLKELGTDHLNNSVALEFKHDIEEITPDSDDFDDCSCALNACVAVLEAFDYHLTGQIEHAKAACEMLTDSVDSKIQVETFMQETEINQHPEMIKARQYLLA